MNEFPSWLTKKMIKGVKGFNLDAYVMALEGWRRGLTLTWYYDPTKVTDLKLIGYNPLGKTFSLYSEEENKTHYFYRSRGDKVANDAVDIVQNKYVTKTYLKKSGVPTPKSVMFNKSIPDETVLKEIQEMVYPLVVKPVFGSLGKGVFTNINDEAELLHAIDEIRKNDEYDEILVERYIEGDEYRIYVVNDEVVAATKRDPANVIGDGFSTIEQLIEQKNEIRKKNPYLANKPIKIDEDLKRFLQKNNLTLQSIPEKDEKVRLKGQSNIAAGGDPIDTTDQLSQSVKDVAVHAVKSISGLVHAGVDAIVTDDDTYVIEINGTADIAMHLFPMEGTSRNVPEKIMDHYFPETKGISHHLKKMYFDFRNIRKIFLNKLAEEITITDAPKRKLYTARYIVSGKVQKVGYRSWIQKRALKQGLHGYAKNLKNGKVVVVVAGDNMEKVKKFKHLCEKGPSKAKVENVKVLEWNASVKAGFEIR